MISLIRTIWHERRHGQRVWRQCSANRPSYWRGVVMECDCGTRWISRAPWDRVAGL